MSVWSTSTGRNSLFGAESSGAVLPSSHLPTHVHVVHEHLRNADGHCFHKPFHDHCQVGRFALADPSPRQRSFLFHPLREYVPIAYMYMRFFSLRSFCAVATLTTYILLRFSLVVFRFTPILR